MSLEEKTIPPKIAYLDWNNLIAKYFFNEAKSGREVLLYVNEELIKTLGADHGADLADFLRAIQEGPPWITRRKQGLCIHAYQALENWRSKNLEYPPYIAYLAFFVLVAGSEGEFASHAYYPRFWTLLGEPGVIRMPPSFEKMIELWDDLEKWSREDKHETWGRFIARIRGSWVNVGLPLSQTLVSEEERRRLPEIFDEAGLDPTTLPTPDVMCRILIKKGNSILENRTYHLLESKKESESALKDAFLGLVLDELEDWDGTVWMKAGDEKPEKPGRQMQAGLRICLVLDHVARTVKGHVRFKTTKAFPEGGLNFIRSGDARIWSCREIYQGWSTALKNESVAPTVLLDSFSLDWVNGEQFCDDENHWRARLKGIDARVFLPGDEENFSEWIESQRLERGVAFLLAYAGENLESVKRWGVASCKLFKELVVTGLPAGWKLFHGENATASCGDVDILSVSSTVRVLVRGGLRLKGNSFLKFAPPHIVLENSTGNEKITLNGTELARPNAKLPVWNLPHGAPVGQALKIEVKSGGGEQEHKAIRNIVLWLEEPELLQAFDNVPRRNALGEIAANDTSGRCVHGATVQWNGERQPPMYSVQLPTHLSERTILIGQEPGQIVDCPREGLPTSWRPVWALVKSNSREWEALFCGAAESTKENYEPGKALSDKNAVRQWKEFLWHQRLKIQAPTLEILNRLWKKYVLVAKNV